MSHRARTAQQIFLSAASPRVPNGAKRCVRGGSGARPGKNRVPNRRIAWLISERKTQPGSILDITFPSKAAAEKKERVEDLVGKRVPIV